MSESAVVEFSSRAYCKMLLHAVKYPHCAVNGLLLAESPSSGGRPSTQLPPAAAPPPPQHNLLVLTDSIPLFHQAPHGLSPMPEVALAQVESRCSASATGRHIAGFYHAPALFNDTAVDVFSQRMADKIAEHTSEPVLVTIDNQQLSIDLLTSAIIVRQNVDGKWRVRSSGSSVRMDACVLPTASALIQAKRHRELLDFDNHLDDVANDYLNVPMNELIDSVVL